MRPPALIHWWGAAAKMVIFNNNIKVPTIIFTGLVSLVATKEWLTKFFNSEVNLLNAKEVGEHGVHWKLESHGLVNTGSVCPRRNAGQ